MEDPKDDVTEMLTDLSASVLKKVRDLAFTELIAIMPEYINKEMKARKKSELIAEDIYIICSTVISGLVDKKISKCWKQETDIESSQINVSFNEDESQNFKFVIELCLKLQETIKSHEKRLCKQDSRIKELENKLTDE